MLRTSTPDLATSTPLIFGSRRLPWNDDSVDLVRRRRLPEIYKKGGHRKPEGVAAFLNSGNYETYGQHRAASQTVSRMVANRGGSR